jgi:hypothetical protein
MTGMLTLFEGTLISVNSRVDEEYRILPEPGEASRTVCDLHS